ncbi:MAG: GyrI-like domain-containing protein [Thermoplasmata archaeon]|nr:GyrI-like domain-containing protein [Thermoplasmata archaeon]
MIADTPKTATTLPHGPATREDQMRELRPFYLAVARSPELVTVPPLRVVARDGRGDPMGTGTFQTALASLYATVYTLKFARKRRGLDFRVMPIEALWWTGPGDRFDPERPRSDWSWSLRIVVPSSITSPELRLAQRAAAARRPDSGLEEVRLETVREGRAAQMLHLGPYSSEGPALDRLFDAIRGWGVTAAGKHHEIYLNDPRRTAPARIRTVLRQPVR